MPAVNFTACPLCMAVIEVTVDGKPVFGDGVELHGKWHERLRETVSRAAGPFGLSLGSMGVTEGI